MIEINIAYYEKKEWKRFLQSIDDKDSMHATWKEWHNAYQKIKEELISQDYVGNDFVVNIDELKNYCKIKRIKNDGKLAKWYYKNEIIFQN